MTTPNPRGVTRCIFWDVLAQAVAERESHWSYDPKASACAKRKAKAQARYAETLASV